MSVPPRKVRTGRLGRRRVLLAAVGCVVGLGAIGLGALFTPHYALYRAERALQARDTDTALEWLERAEKIDPLRAETQFWLARVYRRTGQFDAVRERLARARRLGHPIEELQREQWLTLAQTGHISEAGPHLKELLLNPAGDGREICEAFVNGYCMNLQFGPAQRLLDVWQADFPTDPEPHFRQGYIRQSLFDDQGALEHYRRGLELAPHRSDARVRLGQCLLSLNQPREAEHEFRARLSEHPTDVGALLGLAASLSSQRETEEVQRTYEQVIEIEPANGDARRGLGQLALQAGDAKEAVRWLETLWRERPRDVSTANLLAQAYSAVGERDRARELLHAVRAAEEPLARIGLLLEDVVRRPEDVDLRFEIGTLLMNYGDPDDGARWLRSVLQLDPHHRGAHQALAAHYEDQGLERDAVEHRRQAGRIPEQSDE